MLLSVIIPTIDEADQLPATVASLNRLPQDIARELIVADGGSSDDTLEIAATLADHTIVAPRGRAAQMNAGASRARGDYLLFLHADTRFTAGAVRSLHACLVERPAWGRFNVRLSGTHPLLRVVERLMNLRSRLTGIATGDQGMFVRRDLFEQVGGFPAIALMEDIALSKRLKAIARPSCLRGPVVTSSRRWERHGIGRTIVLMWRLRLLYFLGADPQRLARIYHGDD